MPKVYETSETEKKEYLQTHYYKTMMEPMMTRCCQILEEMSCKILSVNNDYNEISATNDFYDITLKVFQFQPNETAVDFFIDSRYLFDINKTKKNVIDILYEKLEKSFPLKGTALHK